ncbi:hypothetical protein C5167_047190 [Papaver somniferum]|uniref:MCM OB domain-containing protein n=1 Tax=Papaver somniferum TaxID=3469 RepID=A0A4Y7LJI4_PAPSO|nr:hypothetical protein C5167_047190 [Papaver somniferum]
MALVHNRRGFDDKQIVRFQETPYDIPKGGTPHTVSLLMHDKLIDAGKPGDRVETYIDCLHIKKTDKSRMQAEDQIEHLNASDNMNEDVPADFQGKIEQLKELAKSIRSFHLQYVNN